MSGLLRLPLLASALLVVAATALVAPGVDASPLPSDADIAGSASATPTKVLAFLEENHSYSQMRSQMPYLFSLAQQYGYATNWTAIRHPSLPNYLAIAGGSTFGVTDDSAPAVNALKVGPANSIFDQALDAGRTARTYAEGMTSNCALASAAQYAVRHNPWTYFAASGARCGQFDVGLPSLLANAENATLPNVGMVIPNVCNDAHNCTLAVADGWLKTYLGTVLASPDFTSGRLVVVVTADEDDRLNDNNVLTVVMHAGMSSEVVTTPLTHYSLTRYYAQVLGVSPLRNGATAPDMRAAFGL